MNNVFKGIGGHSQALAVKAYLSRMDGIDEAWKDDAYDYTATITDWYNCREHGFVITMYHRGWTAKCGPNQLNIAFFEHRNTDGICAIKWVQGLSIDPPTIDTADFGDTYKDKYDISHGVNYGQAEEMAEWIIQQMTAYYLDSIAS